MNYAQLSDGRVVGVSSLSAEVVADDMIPIDSYDLSLMGKVYDAETGQFYEPAPEPGTVPQTVSMRQARLALLAAGKLSAVDEAIDQIQDPVRRATAFVEWNYSSAVERSSDFVALLGAAVGLTDEETDELFTYASTL